MQRSGDWREGGRVIVDDLLVRESASLEESIPRAAVPPLGLTKRYPELGTGPVSTDIYHDPAIYQKELKAIFERSWYMIGRVEDIPSAGDFFVYELPTFRDSILVCRDKSGSINAFHNVCTHRGNVVEHRTSGKCAGRFVCRFHGWSYGLDGRLAAVRDAEGFFDLDKDQLSLERVSMDLWQGFIWVSPQAEPHQTLEQYLGEMGRDVAAYPWARCTQSYQYEVEVGCNWKILFDSFAETYHLNVLHPTSIGATMTRGTNPFGRLLDARLKGPHRMVSVLSGATEVTNPVQKLAYANMANQNAVRELDYELPEGINPTRSPRWGVDLIMFLPGLLILVAGGMYIVHQIWPLSANRCRYQQRTYSPRAQNAAQRFGQENSMIEGRDVVMEDLSTVERIQRALDTGRIKEFHFHDHEIALRHHHKVICDALKTYDEERTKPC
jgi:phenylpropionate dioxygenase-like ring-hydroxylating dioxygenase large terminal subunit